MIVYPHYIRNRCQWSAIWRDNQPRGSAGRSYFRTLQNACVTAGKTTMTAGKIYHGCFEMLSWSHRTSANIINMFLAARDFIEENIRPGAQRLAFEVKYEYIVRRPRIYRGPAACTWASFQTTGTWCVFFWMSIKLLQHTLQDADTKTSSFKRDFLVFQKIG